MDDLTMLASNVSHQSLLWAAQQIGVRADINSYSEKRHRVKLFPVVTADMLSKSGRRKKIKGATIKARYQRKSAGFNQGHMVHAVCWHGFRDYFRAVFALEPDATFRTVLDTWRGKVDFEARYLESGAKNIGSIMYPCRWDQACFCGHEIVFGTLTESGQLINVRMIRQTDIMRCPHYILVPTHYRTNGSCKCDDPEEQQMMIKEWGYKPQDFK